MLYLDHCFLLPKFRVTTLSNELMLNYFSGLPQATVKVADILSDGIGVNPNTPFIDNILLTAIQKLINNDSLDEDAIASILRALNLIDFKYALIFFVQLSDSCDYTQLCSHLQSLNDETFLKRLNLFLSVLTAEQLCRAV